MNQSNFIGKRSESVQFIAAMTSGYIFQNQTPWWFAKFGAAHSESRKKGLDLILYLLFGE